MKKLWEIIAKELSEMFKITISASKCENRWKVLERNYKAVVDNNNKSGRGRKVFEFEEEFNEIYVKKRNVNPVLLLSNETVTSEIVVDENCNENHDPNRIPELTKNTSVFSGLSSEVMIGSGPSVTISIPELTPGSSKDIVSNLERNSSQSKLNKRRETNSYQKRNEILKEMKNDLKEYYRKKLEHNDDRKKQGQKKMADSEKRTKLYEEHLGLLRQYLEENNNGNSNPCNPFLNI